MSGIARNSVPIVSVIMPVYNAERFVREAVESILNQTFTDFEFIIINDGSTDSTRAILESFADTRIVLLHQENQGLVRSLNRGLRMARGRYIARQDADDVSLPERLERQVAFLDAHPEVGLLASASQAIDEHGQALYVRNTPCDGETLQREFVRGHNPLIHGSVLMRREILDTVGFYDERFLTAEDNDYWLRIAEHWQVAALADVLFRYRIIDTSKTAREGIAFRMSYGALALWEALRRRMGEPRLAGRYTSRDLALGFLALACREAFVSDLSVFQSAILQAVQLDGTLTGWDFAYEMTGWASYVAEAGVGWADATASVRRAYQHLPAQVSHWRRQQNWAFGELTQRAAFAAFRRRDLAEVRRWGRQCWRWQPRLFLRSRGLRSIWIESLIGPSAADWLRRIVHAECLWSAVRRVGSGLSNVAGKSQDSAT